MRTFEAVIPEDVRQCIDLLATRGEDVAILAGGTDLFVQIKTGIKTPGVVIHIAGLKDLGRVERRDGRVTIGPAVTHAELAGHDLLGGLDVLRGAAASIGSPQVRNLGTVGGNIVNASPAGDLYPALLALEATVIIESASGRREVALEDFVTGAGQTTLEPDELLVATAFEDPGHGAAGAAGKDPNAQKVFTGFAKIGLRNSLAISVANAALVARQEDGKLRDVRVACGAVAPTAIRMRGVEDLLEGKEPGEALIEEAARAASSECDPISDIRATRQYRCHVAGILVSRLIRKARRDLLGAEAGNAPEAGDDD